MVHVFGDRLIHKVKLSSQGHGKQMLDVSKGVDRSLLWIESLLSIVNARASNKYVSHIKPTSSKIVYVF